MTTGLKERDFHGVTYPDGLSLSSQHLREKKAERAKGQTKGQKI